MVVAVEEEVMEVVMVPPKQPSQQITNLCPRQQKINWVITQLAKDHWGAKSYKLGLLQGIFEVGIISGQRVKLWIN
ncbi:hypothetical protein Hanom_Chr02g00102721 [Helianthus anomalus]